MTEGRKSQVVLLDERRLDIFIQPRLYAGELLDLVSSHFHLKEKEYFGIAYLNDTGQYWCWLHLDKRVLEHDLPNKKSNGSILTLYFRVKYFVESITQLKDSATAEAFYLQAKSLLSKGELEADSETVFQLASLVLHATYGDYVDDSMFRSYLRRLPIIPPSTLREHSSINNCEDKVLNHYKSLCGQSRGSAIVKYLSIVEKLPTYGQHYYEIKDKTGAPCWLGLSYKGISQYDKIDRSTPQKVFLWKQLENLYYRDKKFTIEVHEARRVVHTLSSFNLYEDAIEEPVEEYDDLSNAICDPTTQVSVSRRTLAPANVTVYVWYASSPDVTKCIWSMAIAQHHFFLDRRHQKRHSNKEPNLSQLASELCQSFQSLSSFGSQSNISRSNSSSSLPSTILGGEISEESKAATIEMLTALRSRKEALEEALKNKTEELKTLCLKEADLIGEIPPETPFSPGEAQPQVRRRVGTAFCLSDKFICHARSKERETLNDLELDYEIQSKIASAAYQLATECTARKSVRKQRKVSYAQATAKLRTIEEKLSTLRREKKAKGESSVLNENDTLDDSGVNLSGSGPETSTSQEAGENSSHAIYVNEACVSSSNTLPQLRVTRHDSIAGNSSKCRQRHQSLQLMHCYPHSSSQAHHTEHCSWSVSSSFCGEFDYDSISCNSSNAEHLRIPYRNKFESRLDIEGSNLYSVPNRRASQVFDSQDDLILGGKKADYDKRSPITKVAMCPIGLSNAGPLSSSYDERMWFDKSKNLATISSECSSLERSFEAQSNFSCDSYSLSHFESNCQRKVPAPSPTTSVKLTHFHSENSLNKDELSVKSFHCDNPHISEPNLVKSKQISHVHSVPHLPQDLSVKVVQEPQGQQLMNSHSINQVAELVHASMLLQGGKRTISTNSIGCVSPKTKTKEWIETSLDSPAPLRKLKQSWDDAQQDQMKSDNHHLRLSPYPKNQYFSGNNTLNKRHAIQQQQSLQLQDQLCSYDSRPPSVNMWSNDEASCQEAFCTSQSDINLGQNCIPSNCYSQNQQTPDDFGLAYKNGKSQPDLSYLKANEQIIENDYENCPVIPLNQANYQSNTPPPLDSQYSNYHSAVPCNSEIPMYTVENNNMYNSNTMPQMCYSNLSISVEPNCTSPPNCNSPAPNANFFHHHSAFQDSSDVLYSPNSLYQETASVINVPKESANSTPTNFSYPSNVEVNVVSVGHFQPYWEETKPYELSDFYKYSTKHRKSQPQYNERDCVVENNVQMDGLDRNYQRQSYEGPPQLQLCTAVSPTFSSRPPCQNSCDQSSDRLTPTTQKPKQEILVNAQFAVIRDPHQEDFCNSLLHHQNSNLRSPVQTGDVNSSFGEMSIGFSLSDNFHDEMLAWYDSQEAIKKATLV